MIDTRMALALEEHALALPETGIILVMNPPSAATPDRGSRPG